MSILNPIEIMYKIAEKYAINMNGERSKNITIPPGTPINSPKSARRHVDLLQHSFLANSAVTIKPAKGKNSETTIGARMIKSRKKPKFLHLLVSALPGFLYIWVTPQLRGFIGLK
jgi:hypothetical protein